MSLKEKVTNYDVQIMKRLYTHWNLSPGLIADMAGLSKSYVKKLISGVKKPSVKSKEKSLPNLPNTPNTPHRPHTPDIIEEEPIDEEVVEKELLEEIYEHYSGQHGDSKYLRDKSWIFNWIKKDYWDKLSKLSRYKNKVFTDEINDIIDDLRARFLGPV